MQPASVLLLVEDTDEVREVLEEALFQGGFELVIAANGTEALSLLHPHTANLHGLITDINLGRGPDGWEVARRARELLPKLPVVYTSGAEGADWASRGVPHSTFVNKPFAPAQVITAISALMNATDVQQ